MFKLTQLIDFAPGADRQATLTSLREAGAAPQVAKVALLPTREGVYNGGDLIWHVQFAEEKAWRDWAKAQKERLAALPNVTHVESVAYEGGPQRATSPGLTNGVYRVALFCANHKATPQRLEAFGKDTFMMGHYIKKIRNWQISRVLDSSGVRPWTHVWEQEYADIAGLQHAYMLHPHHWGHIDRWFDPECQDWLIDTYLCHTFADLPLSVLAPPVR
jgi:hypothetical protein